MRSEQSPFPLHWWGTAIDDVPERPNVGTYGRYKFEALPPLPFQFLGEFEWLADKPAYKSHIGREKPDVNRRSLPALRESATSVDLKLPEPFLKFLETPALHERIRSTTDCFLDVCPALVRSPIGDGYLVRFLADSQSCVFWYVFLSENGKAHAVVSSPDFYGTAAERWEEEEPNPSEIVFCEETFEAFICRFWLENEICFSQFDKTALSKVGKVYLEQYRGRK